MKTLKFLFTLFVFSIIIASCTPQALDDNQTTLEDQTQATGHEDDTVDDGSKD